MNFTKTSIRFKIALFFLVLAFLLHLVGYATAAWFTTDLTVKKDTSTAIVTVQLGLWRLCSCEDTVCLCISLPIATGWLHTVRVLESVSLVTLFICGITTIVKFSGKFTTNRYTKLDSIILQVIGFATTSWATMEINTGGTMQLYLGLWQLCGCYSHYCSCFVQANDRVWFKAVQITEAVGLAGILICGVVTVALLCSKPKGALRIFNFVVLLISSLCIVVGVIIFGCETMRVIEFEEEIDNVDIDLRSSLGFSFYISAIAGGIGLLVCIPLFVADSRSKQLERPETAAQCSNQGHIVIASTGIVNINGQPQADYFHHNMTPGNMQPYPVFYSQGHVGLSVQGYMAPPYARDPPPYTEKPTAGT